MTEWGVEFKKSNAKNGPRPVAGAIEYKGTLLGDKCYKIVKFRILSFYTILVAVVP